MSKADKMFKDLKFNKHSNNLLTYIEYTQKRGNEEAVISFDLKTKTTMTALYVNKSPISRGCALYIEEIQAINEKWKELGWLNNE